MTAVRSLLTLDGKLSRPSPEEVRALGGRKPEAPYWLDIQDPAEEDYRLLLDDYRFHPLSVEDVRTRNQRPKLDAFPGYLFMVLFTAERRPHDQLAVQEHHLFLAHDAFVTVHWGPAPSLDELRKRLAADPTLTRADPIFLHYLVVNALVESLFPVLDRVDERIDALEDTIVERPARDTIEHITTVRHAVTDLRRILSAQRDLFQKLLTHSKDSSQGEMTIYWRDVYDNLIRQYEQVDSLRDLLSGAMDLYLSDASNRLGVTTKQLTVIASLFLPLSFLTGFFGMNFGFLVNHIGGPEAFALGLILMALCTAIQLYVFRVRGWI